MPLRFTGAVDAEENPIGRPGMATEELGSRFTCVDEEFALLDTAIEDAKGSMSIGSSLTCLSPSRCSGTAVSSTTLRFTAGVEVGLSFRFFNGGVASCPCTGSGGRVKPAIASEVSCKVMCSHEH